MFQIVRIAYQDRGDNGTNAQALDPTLSIHVYLFFTHGRRPVFLTASI